MRGKLRDKRDVKSDRLKREIITGRRPNKRDNRNLQLQQFNNNDDKKYTLDEEGELTITEDQQN